jgi:hypothetical protein
MKFERTFQMFPLVSFQTISLGELNECLVLWNHKMGPLHRPDFGDGRYHALFHEGRPVAVAAASQLIAPHVGGGLSHLKRETTVELSRLCAESPHLNRVVLRLWREFVFPCLGVEAAISYQDAVIHSGNLYRFDGWRRSSLKSNSGTHSRSGKRGRSKWIWVWPPGMEKNQ